YLVGFYPKNFTIFIGRINYSSIVPTCIMKIMTLKHLLSFFLILVLFSASLCYAQHKMLRTKEDIQAFNDTMLFSLKENRHAAFSAGISDVWKSLGTGEV